MKTNSALSKIGMFLGAVALTGTALAQDSHCEDRVGSREPTTPSSAFIDLGDGTVRHTETGLQWSRCAIGQQFNGRECEGQAQVLYWEEATDAVAQVNSRSLGGQSDWRVPTLPELLSLVEECREAPAINPEIFPNTPWTGFWSATLHRDADDPHEAEHVENPAYRGAHQEDEDGEDEFSEDRPEKNPEAWFVGFYKGLEYPYDIYSSYRVRPVRTAN
mgnify:CR=1 FL=1